jgi:cyclophilin family peptidyl-prolyl cis-trans isomerase
MDHETKITYIVIAVLIIFLGGVALVLQPTSALPEEKVVSATTTKKIIQPLTTTASTTTTTSTSTASTTKPMEEQKTFSTATITTSKGVIEIAFLSTTPNTVKNFGTLATSKFYNGVRFHRVIKDFMIQTGDPFSKDPSKVSMWGKGDPGYKFNDELTGSEQYPLGTVAMANSGPNTNGSQFFIVTANPGAGLPPRYTVFGKVTKGIDVALAIQEVKTTGDPLDRPLEDIVIEKVEAR